MTRDEAFEQLKRAKSPTEMDETVKACAKLYLDGEFSLEDLVSVQEAMNRRYREMVQESAKGARVRNNEGYYPILETTRDELVQAATWHDNMIGWNRTLEVADEDLLLDIARSAGERIMNLVGDQYTEILADVIGEHLRD